MFHLAAGSPRLGGMFAGCTQIALLRLPVSAESLRRKTVHIRRVFARHRDER